MKNPTKKQVKYVIDRLNRIEDQSNKEGAFNIDKPWICGTVHCVAGWYLLANKQTKYFKSLDEKEGTRRTHYMDSDGNTNYACGAMLMAKHLGFEDGVDLEEWAKENPDIWGNVYGDGMFCDEDSYNNLKPDSEKPMSIVINHWEGVMGRLPK